MPTIDLQKIARSCVGFSEFVEKAEAAIENPRKYFKQQGEANTLAITRDCLSFGEFQAKMATLRGEPTNVR